MKGQWTMSIARAFVAWVRESRLVLPSFVCVMSQFTPHSKGPIFIYSRAFRQTACLVSAAIDARPSSKSSLRASNTLPARMAETWNTWPQTQTRGQQTSPHTPHDNARPFGARRSVGFGHVSCGTGTNCDLHQRKEWSKHQTGQSRQ